MSDEVKDESSVGSSQAAQHTPGPWEAISDSNGSGSHEWAVRPQGNPLGIAICLTEGDARLSAAAPELLEALKAVVAIADRKTVEFDRARAAVAKATGAEA